MSKFFTPEEEVKDAVRDALAHGYEYSQILGWIDDAVTEYEEEGS